jgi:mycothiol system anti-sigma-R factor
MTSDCQEVREALSGFVDEELAPDRRGEIATHLQACPGCNTQAQVQRAVKTLLHDHSPHDAAPHHLRARIMHHLRHPAQRDSLSFGSLLRRLFEFQRAPAFASLGLLIALAATIALWGGSRLAQKTEQPDPLAVTWDGQLEGEIVCIDCTLLDVLQTPYTHDSSHRLGVRCTDGHFWSILQSAKGSELSSKANMAEPRRIRLKGRIFPAQHQVEVTDFSFI